MISRNLFCTFLDMIMCIHQELYEYRQSNYKFKGLTFISLLNPIQVVMYHIYIYIYIYIYIHTHYKHVYICNVPYILLRPFIYIYIYIYIYTHIHTIWAYIQICTHFINLSLYLHHKILFVQNLYLYVGYYTRCLHQTKQFYPGWCIECLMFIFFLPRKLVWMEYQATKADTFNSNVNTFHPQDMFFFFLLFWGAGARRVFYLESYLHLSVMSQYY